SAFAAERPFEKALSGAYGRQILEEANRLIAVCATTGNRMKQDEGGAMSCLAAASIAATLMSATLAYAAEPIALRDMGSFHVGGRLVEISGKPVKEVTFTPGGVPAKVDPNGTYQVEQMYVQYFLPANEKGAYPLLMWHGGGL